MTARFEIFQDNQNEWRFRLRARNGRIIATSESYTSKRNAEIGIESVKDCASDAVILYKID